MTSHKKIKQLSTEANGFPIVGIGASAGGLEAFTQLFSALSTETGMGFVVIQHLDPNHESLTPEILSRTTQMPVLEIKDGMRVLPNHVYVIPSNVSVVIFNGVLGLLPRDETHGNPIVIDSFFQSLATDQRGRAIGIVLSGTASDGTQGLKAIKAEGGIAIVQDPKSAKFDGMPNSAIASGIVDLILPPEEIAHELARISHHPYILAACEEKTVSQNSNQDSSDDSGNNEEDDTEPEEALRKIFILLRAKMHVDFSNYKYTTLKRRLERRMMVRKSETIDAYLQYVHNNPDEIKALYADFLINVTEFFRDPDSFKALKDHVFPSLMKNRAAGAPIRVWVPGCATGEEVYSLAILLLEFLGAERSKTTIQIFATDISEQALKKARAGVYSEGIERVVSKERLRLFFDKVAGGYKINKTIRSLCLFSRHDVTTDPPFAKLDIVSCRNLLIYFGAILQKRVISIFHYSLNPGGFLWLGNSESPGAHSKLFAITDKTHKIYLKSNIPTPANFRFPMSTYTPADDEITQKISERFTGKSDEDFQKNADRIALTKYAPPSVVVNADMEILQFRGRTVPYLEQASGLPSNNLLKMVRHELLHDLSATIQLAIKQNTPVRREGLSFEVDGKQRHINIEVIPANPLAPLGSRHFVIFFEETSFTDLSKSEIKKAKDKGTKKKSGTDQQAQRIEQLLQESSASKLYQQSRAEEFETSQEELTASNEELQSTNEELQSTNEELETAKEELQSSNEELTTVNDELQNRNTDLVTISSDLNNLLSSVEIPILIISNDHRIRRYTPKAEKVFKLIPSDIGRPIGDIRPNFDADLDALASDVIKFLRPHEQEILDRTGRWVRLQIRPYKTIDNRIDGAVIVVTDIDALKQILLREQEGREEAEKDNRAKDLFLATLSHELRTPLTSILSWAQMLRMGKMDSEKSKRAVEIIEKSAKLQQQLISDLLDVSRAIMGKLPLELQEIDPTSAIQDTLEAIRPLVEEKSIKLKTVLDPITGVFRADKVRLQQIFWNLLTNAIKFSEKGSAIEIRLEAIKVESKDCIRIKVIDTGKGIPRHFLPTIFDRFSQADSTSTREHGGLGLGLAIVRNLTELHGGSVKAESEGLGKGSTFTVSLPLSPPHQETQNIPAKHRESLRQTGNGEDDHPKLNGIRVLIVDDEDYAREAFTELLSSFGAETKAVASAREAFVVFSEFKPHVLMSDIAMPGEDGYSLMRKIRALGPKQGGDVPSLALTAFANGEDVQNAYSAGFQAHLAKPVESIDLARSISNLANRIPKNI